MKKVIPIVHTVKKEVVPIRKGRISPGSVTHKVFPRVRVNREWKIRMDLVPWEVFEG